MTHRCLPPVCAALDKPGAMRGTEFVRCTAASGASSMHFPEQLEEQLEQEEISEYS